jgi:hypothetical protein
MQWGGVGEPIDADGFVRDALEDFAVTAGEGVGAIAVILDDRQSPVRFENAVKFG